MAVAGELSAGALEDARPPLVEVGLVQPAVAEKGPQLRPRRQLC